MPYDGQVERDEFLFRDLRPRPERDYRPERELPERRMMMPERPRNPLADVVNNPAVTVTPAEVKAINNPDQVMTQDGRILNRSSFERYPMLSTGKPKQKRKVSKYQKLFGKHLKILKVKHPRTKIGTLMKRAHRMTRKVLK